ncbi:MAG: tetratricopeptide repeat protein, partial [Planctomycetes bacterium]|nr:tetratricopeptide repeat protein [Planctomycetota bacterium]
ADLAERIRLRLAASLLAKGNVAAALTQAEAVAKNPKTPFAAEARYLVGEARIAKKDWAKAIEQLAPFRDQVPLQNVPGIGDRALLRLGQAYAEAGQWDPSRQAFEILRQRFPQSPWFDEALYGIGWAWQSQKQHDNAVGTYVQVTRRTAAEVAARAQLQIGLCRLEQNKVDEALQALLAVPMTYDYPDLSAAAWCEAARAYVAKKQPAEATGLLQKVVKDHPKSPWAEVARKRLAEIGKGTG